MANGRQLTLVALITGESHPQEFAEQASQAGLQKALHFQHGPVKFLERSQISQLSYFRTVRLRGKA
ncbi:MAG TPA: hypothetical protein VLA60_00900 [Nitrospirales bacterium]|nr:hypothetical protein [Nitrospirales bacterium]